MLISELIIVVKDKLKLDDNSRDQAISDVIQQVMVYCNLTNLPLEVLADLDDITVDEEYTKIEIPFELEPFIRRKVKTIIDYEALKGTAAVFDLKSVSEGDTSRTYNTDQVSRETVYGLSDSDKKYLKAFRRLRH